MEQKRKITRAIITAAGKGQRNLPLQTIIDRDGRQKSVLGVIIEAVLRGGINDICFIVHSQDEAAFHSVVADYSINSFFVHQDQPLGYGHAVWLARDFVQKEAFLHLISDHLYVSRSEKGCAQRVLEAAAAQSCAVSAVQATRESLLPNFIYLTGEKVRSQVETSSMDGLTKSQQQ